MKALDQHSTSDWHAFIAPIANRLMDFSKRNPLLNLDQSSYIFSIQKEIDPEQTSISISIDKQLQKILRRKKQILRETGLNTLYLTYGVYEIQNEELNRLPFYIVPIDLKFNKDLSEIDILPDWDSKVVNPLLDRLVADKYNLEVKEESVRSWDCHIGIFNYKKYILLDEIGKMTEADLSNPIRELFDFEPDKHTTSEKIQNLDSYLITDADPSQRNIIEKSMSDGSFCVQGPPGTGKSQTISNIISANLKLGKKILFVSEKKAAIDVVYSNLNKAGIGDVLTQITDSGSDKKEFIQSLSNQWESNRKQEEEIKSNDYSASFSKVSLFLDHLFRFQPDLGISLNEALKNIEISELKSVDTAPKLENWLKIKDIISFVYSELEKETISQEDISSFLELKPSLFKETELKEKLELHTRILSDNLEKIQTQLDSISDLQKQCVDARVICGLQFKEKIEILKVESQQKKFRSESKRYLKLKNEIQNLKVDLKSWKKIPSAENINFWKKHLKEKGWFNSKRKQAINSLEEHLSGPVDDPTDLFETTLKYLETEKKWNSCLMKLKRDFQITSPEREIDELNLILSKRDLHKSSFDRLLDEDLESLEELDQLNPVLDKIQHSKRFLFGSRIDSLEYLCKVSSNIQRRINFLERNKEQFYSNYDLNKDEIKFYSKHSNISQIEEKIYHFSISEVIEKSSILKDMSSKEFNASIKAILKKRKANHKSNAFFLKRKLKQDFQALEELLITPAGRLKEDEKHLKKTVRAGKRILTHEFSKTKRYKAIRELCELESKEWVFRMKKVWMMNPLSVSEILPFEKEQFDLLIIDEASQLPEEDIIPSLFRAKQVIIVGDKMQMPPSNFFSGNEVGPSILDTAHFRLPNEMLKWHYRSRNPELINFSNHAFYDSQLIVNPSLHPNEKSLTYNFVDDSNYNEGTNSKEAEELIKYLKKNLIQSEGIIGIGCFSLAQQKTIERILQKDSSLVDRTENETLFVRNLENLQGDECDHLLISIGYGPNKEGKLNMNFGPLSKNGGHNRLNVLITRARISVNVFASFKPEDLKLTDNEGINYLKDYLHYLINHSSDITWPDLSIDSEKQSAKISIEEEVEIETILSRFNVLQETGFETSVKTRLFG